MLLGYNEGGDNYLSCRKMLYDVLDDKEYYVIDRGVSFKGTRAGVVVYIDHGISKIILNSPKRRAQKLKPLLVTLNRLRNEYGIGDM
jgi:hypothetical protein